METISRQFILLSSAFAHGAYQSQGANHPDLRPPSVKGQLRWWYDALFRDQQSENRILGYVSSKENKQLGLEGNHASLLAVRLHCPGGASFQGAHFMPHSAQKNARKNAIPPGTRFEVSLIPRREGLNSQQFRQIERALDAWLLLGAIGQRANRGAGSPWPLEAPETEADFHERADFLLADSMIRCAALPRAYDNETDLRRDAGDFLAAEAFARCRTPFGSAEPRKPSPLRLRAAFLDGALRLVAVWDSRWQSGADLREGVDILSSSDKPLGRLLEPVLHRLAPR